MDEDIALMMRAKEDDLEAFEQLYQKHASSLGNFFWRLGCGLETEDYIQETFMRLWRARHRYEPRAKFTTFLFQIAKNYWINEQQKKQRRPDTLYIEKEGNEDQISQDEFFTDQEQPEEKIITGELHQKIQEAINELSDNYRLVFVLSQIEGFKYREVAEILEIPIGTVKSRMSTAEAKLRKKLEQYVKQ